MQSHVDAWMPGYLEHEADGGGSIDTPSVCRVWNQWTAVIGVWVPILIRRRRCSGIDAALGKAGGQRHFGHLNWHTSKNISRGRQ